jgi:DNA-binding transcriptional regulator GbsR (MarR family)
VAQRSNKVRDEAGVARFIERFSGALTDAGMPRMPARLFAALLVAEDGGLTSAQLAAQMQVSPAAISGGVRYLMQVGLVTRHREPGERRDTYRLYNDMWYELIGNQDQRYLRMIDALQQGVEAVGPATPTGRRLDETARFFDFIRVEMTTLMQRWREQPQPRRSR